MHSDSIELERNQPAQHPLPGANDHAAAIPEDAMAIVAMRNVVLFPGMILPLTIGRRPSILAAQQAVKTDRLASFCSTILKSKRRVRTICAGSELWPASCAMSPCPTTRT